MVGGGQKRPKRKRDEANGRKRRGKTKLMIVFDLSKTRLRPARSCIIGITEKGEKKGLLFDYWRVESRSLLGNRYFMVVVLVVVDLLCDPFRRDQLLRSVRPL